MKETAVRWVEGRINGVLLRPLKMHSDERGWLAELYRTDELPPELVPLMGYLSVTHPGCTRGPHAHIRQTDYFGFVFPARFKLKLWDNRKDSATYGHTVTQVVGDTNLLIAVVPPGVVHGYKNISDQDGVILNFPNSLYAGKGRKESIDEIRYEDQQPVIFSMED